MKLHKLKTVQPYFSKVKYYNGRVENYYKKFEVRFNDRNFKEKDLLLLLEYDSQLNTYSGDGYFTQINYILDYSERLKENTVILGLHPICVIENTINNNLSQDLLNKNIDYNEFLELNEEDCLKKLIDIMNWKNVGCYEKVLEWKKKELI